MSLARAKLARGAAADHDVVVVASEEGTVNEILNGHGHANQEDKNEGALRVIGSGRGNDFADMVDISDHLEDACTILVQRISRRIDVRRGYGGKWTATRDGAFTEKPCGHLWPVE